MTDHQPKETPQAHLRNALQILEGIQYQAGTADELLAVMYDGDNAPKPDTPRALAHTFAGFLAGQVVTCDELARSVEGTRRRILEALATLEAPKAS